MQCIWPHHERQLDWLAAHLDRSRSTRTQDNGKNIRCTYPASTDNAANSSYYSHSKVPDTQPIAALEKSEKAVPNGSMEFQPPIFDPADIPLSPNNIVYRTEKKFELANPGADMLHYSPKLAAHPAQCTLSDPHEHVPFSPSTHTGLATDVRPTNQNIGPQNLVGFPPDPKGRHSPAVVAHTSVASDSRPTNSNLGQQNLVGFSPDPKEQHSLAVVTHEGLATLPTLAVIDANQNAEQVLQAILDFLPIVPA